MAVSGHYLGMQVFKEPKIDVAAAQKGDVRHVVRPDLLGVRFCDVSDTVGMPNDPNNPYANRLVDRNVFGEDLAMCGIDPVTGFYRDGCCSTGPGTTFAMTAPAGWSQTTSRVTESSSASSHHP